MISSITRVGNVKIEEGQVDCQTGDQEHPDRRDRDGETEFIIDRRGWQRRINNGGGFCQRPQLGQAF